MNKGSKTDWERLEAMTDEEIDVSDIPPLTDKFFANVRVIKFTSDDPPAPEEDTES